VGGTARRELEERFLQFSSETWPYPLVKFYLDRTTFENVMEFAEHPNPVISRRQTSEAYFYYALKLLVEGQGEQANRYFRKVTEGRGEPWPPRMLAEKQINNDLLKSLGRK
jgi:lipoprotein NlpI